MCLDFSCAAESMFSSNVPCLFAFCFAADTKKSVNCSEMSVNFSKTADFTRNFRAYATFLNIQRCLPQLRWCYFCLVCGI